MRNIRGMSRIEILLTKIRTICSEIRDIKEENKSNNICRQPVPTRNPRSSHTPAATDIHGEGDLRGMCYEDNSSNRYSEISYSQHTAPPHEEHLSQSPLLSTLSSPSPPRTSLPDPEELAESPSESSCSSRKVCKSACMDGVMGTVCPSESEVRSSSSGVACEELGEGGWGEPISDGDSETGMRKIRFCPLTSPNRRILSERSSELLRE